MPVFRKYPMNHTQVQTMFLCKGKNPDERKTRILEHIFFSPERVVLSGSDCNPHLLFNSNDRSCDVFHAYHYIDQRSDAINLEAIYATKTNDA